MTCIVGYIDKVNNRVIIGADSAGVAGLDLTIRKDPKVFKVGEFIIGGTSSFRMLQLLRFSFVPPKIQEKDIYEYMCTEFVDAIRDCFTKGGYIKKESERESGGCFLVGYKNRLFCIQDNFQVGELDEDFDSVGCGQSFAFGAFHALKKHRYSAHDRVLKVLEVAETCSAGVSKPFTLLHT